MKRTALKPFLWLTVFVGCSGLLTAIPQSVRGQANSSRYQLQLLDPKVPVPSWINQTSTPIQQSPQQQQTISPPPQSSELEETNRLAQQVIQLYQQGKYNKAIPIAERVLEMRKKLLGQEHPDVALSLNNLATLYDSQGKYAEAEPLYQQALEMYKKLLGPEHPSVARNLNSLGVLYSSQGKYEEAEPLYQQALEMTQKLLGPDHPNTQTVSRNLQFCLQKLMPNPVSFFEFSTNPLQPGELAEINGFPIENIEILSEGLDVLNTEESVNKKWNLIKEIVNQPTQNRNLSGFDLSDANLRGADLRGANLTGANLTGANLTGADLTGDVSGESVRRGTH